MANRRLLTAVVVAASGCMVPHSPLGLGELQGLKDAGRAQRAVASTHVERVSRIGSAVREPLPPGTHIWTASVVDSLGAKLANHGAHSRIREAGKRAWRSLRRGRRRRRPHGRWTVTAVHVAPSWVARGWNPDADVAFLTVARRMAPRASRRTSSRRPAVTASGPLPGEGEGATVTGYPAGMANDPITCRTVYLSHPRVPDVSMRRLRWAGTQWLAAAACHPNDGLEVVGVIGGLEERRLR